MRSSGSFGKVKGLARSFKVYDFSDSRHARAIQTLNLARRDQTPYVTVVALGRDSAPTKKLWGHEVKDLPVAINSLQTFLGLPTTTIKPIASSQGLQTLPPLPTEGWAFAKDHWQHASGLFLLAKGWNGTDSKEEGLQLEDRFGNKLFLFAAEGEQRRDALVANLQRALEARMPDVVLGEVEEKQVGELKMVKRENPAAPGIQKVLVGSIGVGPKSIVYMGIILPGADQGFVEDDMDKVLYSLKFRRI